MNIVYTCSLSQAFFPYNNSDISNTDNIRGASLTEKPLVHISSLGWYLNASEMSLLAWEENISRTFFGLHRASSVIFEDDAGGMFSKNTARQKSSVT